MFLGKEGLRKKREGEGEKKNISQTTFLRQGCELTVILPFTFLLMTHWSGEYIKQLRLTEGVITVQNQLLHTPFQTFLLLNLPTGPEKTPSKAQNLRQPQHLWQWHTSHKSWHWFSFRSQDSLQGSRHCEKEKGVSSSKNQPHQSVSAVEMVPTCGGLTGTSLRHFPYHLCSNQTHHFLLRIMAKPLKGANSPLQKQIWEKVCLSGAGCLLKTLLLLGFCLV